MPFDPWRGFVLARIDAEIAQYKWETPVYDGNGAVVA